MMRRTMMIISIDGDDNDFDNEDEFDNNNGYDNDDDESR